MEGVPGFRVFVGIIHVKERRKRQDVQNKKRGREKERYTQGRIAGKRG